jgi:ATP-dependent protease ClpP protease subunit
MAILNINAPIVSQDEKKLEIMFTGESDAISFKDVNDFISKIPKEDDTIDMRIHCPGGDCSEGWAIQDALRASGKKITALIEGECASMASVILLAASVRRGAPHAKLLIHNTCTYNYCLPDTCTAAELQQYATDLENENQKILDYYVERTGTDREVLKAQMDKNKEVDMPTAKALGFITEIVEPISAIRRNPTLSKNHKHFQNTNNSMGKDNKLAKAFAALGNALGLAVEVKHVDIELTSADGQKLTIDIPEGQDPAVGDTASPDGEFTMPDGKVITVENGKITKIAPADKEPEDNPELADLQKELDAKKKQCEELQGQIDALKADAKSDDDKKILDLVKTAGGINWLENAHSNYKPDSRIERPQDKKNPKPEPKVTKVDKRIAAARKIWSGEKEDEE